VQNEKETAAIAKEDSQKETEITILVKNKEQLLTLMSHNILCNVSAVYLEDQAMDAYISLDECQFTENIELIYAMPYILRNKDNDSMISYLIRIIDAGIRKVLVRNVESLSLVKKMQSEYKISIVTDASLYSWNKEAKEAFLQYADKVTLPLELNAKELRPLRDNCTEQIIYGNIPLMITANCIYKTNGSCQISSGKQEQSAMLKDRYGKNFPVLTNCKYCYNTIFNSVPLSLHKKYNKNWAGSIRLQFSTEVMQEMQNILDYYYNWYNDNAVEFPIAEYTTAHENRQVE
jgi:putative protease